MASPTMVTIEAEESANTTNLKPPLSPQPFSLRPAHLSDLPTIATQNTRAYWNSPFHHHFICPDASSYPSDYRRIFLQKLRSRFLTSNNRTVVACLTSDPSTIVGFAQFFRIGNDAGAEEVVKAKGRFHLSVLTILAWYFWAYDILNNLIWPDRITNYSNLSQTEVWFMEDNEKYWNPQTYPARKNRWHANSVVVAPEWQCKGVGTLLMGEVLKWAQMERVVVGLMSSPAGDALYKNLGFQMLGDYHKRIEGEVGGGTMIWYPEGWEGGVKENSG